MIDGFELTAIEASGKWQVVADNALDGEQRRRFMVTFPDTGMRTREAIAYATPELRRFILAS